MKSAADYAAIIMNDEREKIVKETPTIYTEEFIERVYEFADGAVVKYEWQSTPDGRTSAEEKFNHRFSLVKTPQPNPHKLKEGIISQINYPKA
ncbi:MAG TPA: hypothetical protein PKY59_16675 [Pyrinomonadaceae bacterium]|nr:hypothetical protein [Pyrinomonadaceae bacterium]